MNALQFAAAFLILCTAVLVIGVLLIARRGDE